MEGLLSKVVVVVLLLLVGASLVNFTAAADCVKTYNVKKENKVFANCKKLRAQKAELAWTLERGPVAVAAEVVFAGEMPAVGGWVGWGINLVSASLMVGTQAFIAFQAANGSTLLTYNVTAETAQGAPLACSPIALQVRDMEVHVLRGTSVVMWVSLLLPPLNNQSSSSSLILNHVWNRGSSVRNFQPSPHGGSLDDLSAIQTIDMASGFSSASSPPPPGLLLKNRHGVLNTVGWGIMLPCGVIAARYLRPFADPAWFYLHVCLQMIGYALGVAGWATGLRLGNDSVGIVYRKHRVIGIVLFAMATLQVTAILMRPKKDHKVRKVWKVYHYTLGGCILVLGILNIFFGFDILSPPWKWRCAYIGLLVALTLLTLLLEALRCIHMRNKG